MEFRRIKFIFDAQFCGRNELVVRIPTTWADEKIKERFIDIMGIPFNEDYCSYEFLEDDFKR